MKKLLLVLMVVAMASFLFVGCFGVPDDGTDGDGDGDVIVEATMTFGSEYTNPAGETFIRCWDDILTVTTPTAVETDYVVYAAVKMYEGVKAEVPDGEYYDCMVALTPDPTRTIWTLDYTKATGDKIEFLSGYTCDVNIGECEPFCVVALVKHPCCPGEEIALRIVSADCTPPTANLAVTFYDCLDPCTEYPVCDPPAAGAYAVWTSRSTPDCDTIDCCEDDCSGVYGWSLVVEPSECDEPCDEVSGLGCPIEGTLDCGCLVYPTAGTSEVVVAWALTDNVGNEVGDTASIILGTEGVLSINGDAVTMGEAVVVAGGNCPPPAGL